MAERQPIAALTSIRGLAAWWVVLFHFRELLPFASAPPVRALLAHGYVAVDLFFELSGFVIALNYARLFESADLVVTLRFLGLRLARIYPLHIAMLALFCLNPLMLAIFSHAGLGGGRYAPGYFAMSVFLVQNWGFTRQLAWNIPAWSISTEWLAYLFFPLLLRAVAAARGRVGALLCGCGLMLVLLAIVGAGAGSLGADIPRLGAFRCLAEFTLGICLFHLTEHMRRSARQSSMAAGVGIFALSACVAGFAPDYLAIPLSFLLITYAATDRTSALSRLLAWRGFEAAGVVSYSTYLVHYFVKDWVKLVLVRPDVPRIVPALSYLVVTAVASVLLYRLVEVPGRSLGRALVLRLTSRREVGGVPT